MTILLSVLLSLYDLKSLGFPILAWLLPTLGLFFFAPLSPIFLILCLLGILAEMTDIKIGSGDFFYLASLSLGLSLTALLWVIELGALAGILSYLHGREFTVPDVWFLEEFRQMPCGKEKVSL